MGSTNLNNQSAYFNCHQPDLKSLAGHQHQTQQPDQQGGPQLGDEPGVLAQSNDFGQELARRDDPIGFVDFELCAHQNQMIDRFFNAAVQQHQHQPVPLVSYAGSAGAQTGAAFIQTIHHRASELSSPTATRCADSAHREPGPVLGPARQRQESQFQVHYHQHEHEQQFNKNELAPLVMNLSTWAALVVHYWGRRLARPVGRVCDPFRRARSSCATQTDTVSLCSRSRAKSLPAEPWAHEIDRWLERPLAGPAGWRVPASRAAVASPGPLARRHIANDWRPPRSPWAAPSSGAPGPGPPAQTSAAA